MKKREDLYGLYDRRREVYEGGAETGEEGICAGGGADRLRDRLSG